ncbi:MAG: efflux RND transporter permease subunit [Gammaproteobacteria bacterium]|nr:efflux RND transporter permease subunit [Gammaproteobacteria bacterium]
MWIVQLALRRPYTFIVLALAIVLLGVFTLLRMPTDIFPNIDIPIIGSIWQYTGLPPDEMASRLVTSVERSAQTTVNDLQHTESHSLTGMAVIKYFFQPGVNVDLAYAQITGVSQTQLRSAPPGITPPFILAYNAASVPILQLALDSPTLSESQIFDLANTVVRPTLTSVPGAAMPYPYGGRQRQVRVDLDSDALRARSLSASDVSAALGEQNLIIPAGTQKIGGFEYSVRLNSSPVDISGIGDLPLRNDRGSVTLLRDVASVHDGSGIQTNLVRVNGRRSVLLSVLKTGTASTLDIVAHVKELLPRVAARLPRDLAIHATSDQSLFVRAAVGDLLREGIIAALLTGLLILLFLGSWRSTAIITISIPLSILASIICLGVLGETLNIMTLGGLALAIGILIDDATVTIENINWHLERGLAIEPAILEGARQIAPPALVSMLCICIAFVPMFFLTGVPRFLFVPLAAAVVFAMMASYLLSRTLVPTLAKYWLRHPAPRATGAAGIVLMQQRFAAGFARLRETYRGLLGALLSHRLAFALPFLAAGVGAVLLAPWLGRDFFPAVDGGEIRLHVRARSGTRIEETARLCDAIERHIRTLIPAREIVAVVDNIGVPYSGINMTYSTSMPIGPGDADIMVTLARGHRPTAYYVRALRKSLRQAFPAVNLAFQPADIVSQILNFGLPAPIDVQITGTDIEANRVVAGRLLGELRRIPGLVDARIQQAFDYPQVRLDVDRSRASQLGLTQRDVAGNLLVSLSGTLQSAPAFWLDPQSGTQYSIVTQSPQYRLSDLQDLAAVPISPAAAATQLLGNLVSVGASGGPAVVSHYDARPVIDLYGGVDRSDLGSVVAATERAIAAVRPQLARGIEISLRGQAVTMQESFRGLGWGMAGAVLLIYLLLVVNFQSWLDPLIIISALPAAIAGIVWMLFLTGTTLSVPSLIGAIMCMGVATANSILVVSFARERLASGATALEAALEAGYMRFRPVVMTALAMIVGMLALALALALGEGAEQNAPLGRAVIGGLVFATLATLLFVPVVFAFVHAQRARGVPSNE